MTTTEERRRLLEHLESKEFRDALVQSDLANGILYQMKATLEDRGCTQERLAEKAGTSQPVISKYLKGYENFSLKTLLKLASAFDVSFTAHFERFSDLANRHLNVDWASLAIPDYHHDTALRAPVTAFLDASATAHPGSFISDSPVAPTSLELATDLLERAIQRQTITPREPTLPHWPSETTTQHEGKKVYALTA